MEKYERLDTVGEGSYGLVMKCRHKETGQLVAIKKFLETEEDQTVRKMALREIRMLKKLRHENLVNMIEVFRKSRRYFLVFEYMDHTILDELDEQPGGLGAETTREYIFQVVRGIDFCHRSKVLHRDVKPENILVSRLGVVKLCDFGFARLMATQGDSYTDYVATRWYRAPELLVGDTKYGKEVDIWAVGCLFAEMMSGEPLFPGESDIDQLFQITRLLGKLSHRHHLLIVRNSMFKGLKKPSDEQAARSLSKRFPDWPYLALDFVTLCLKLDPMQRPTSQELLRLPYFTHDNFIERFQPELSAKVQRENQANPLLRGLGVGQSAAKRSKDRISAEESNRSLTLQRRGSYIEPPRWKISLVNDNRTNNENKKNAVVKPIPSRRRLSDNSNTSVHMDVSEENNNVHRTEVFKNSSHLGSSLLFSKMSQSRVQEENESSPATNVSPPSPSPPPFQSLQANHFLQAPHTPSFTQTPSFAQNSSMSGNGFLQGPNHPSGSFTQAQGLAQTNSYVQAPSYVQNATYAPSLGYVQTPSYAHTTDQFIFPPSSSHNLQVLHPSINNLSFGSCESNHHVGGSGANLAPKNIMEPLKRSPQVMVSRSKEKILSTPANPIQLSAIPRTHLIRRLDRGLFIDVSQIDKTQVCGESPNNDKWQNNRRLGAIKTNENAAWRANKMAEDFTLPNVPGASGSPTKGMKKKYNVANLHPNPGDNFAPNVREKPRYTPFLYTKWKTRQRISLDLPHKLDSL